MSSLAGHVALVSGGCGGIGGAVVAALRKSGATVVSVDKAAPSPAQGVETSPMIAADLTSDSEVARVVETVTQRFGRLDVVVCAHGGSGRRFGDGPIHACSPAGWDATLAMNLRSAYLLYHHTVPVLRSGGGGAIVSVSSVLGLVGGDGDFATHAYAAAKGAMISMTRAMAATYAADRIRCNVVCPGLIATSMSARAQADPKIVARLSELQPLSSDFGTPADVAEAVLFLAAPGSSFVTGAVLTVDGGWTVR